MKTYTRATPTPWTRLGHELPSVTSTNALLHERAQGAARAGEPLPLGTSLRADFQTAGRGRHGRHWEGGAGENLYVSYLLSAAGLAPSRLFTLSQVLALAVRDTVAGLAPAIEAYVKWPNDVFLGGRKVAGLLMEASLSGEHVSYVVAGIGLNVNQVDFATAPEATSLRAVVGTAFPPAEVWAALSRKLQIAHESLASAVAQGDTYAISHRYHRHLLGFGRRGRYLRLADGALLTARLQSVDAAGLLVLEHDGREHRYSMGEVRYRGAVG